MPLKFEYDRVAIIEFCARWRIIEFAVFGSALRVDFSPESDLDVMLSFHPDAHRSLFDMARMKEELEYLFKRNVDLLTRRGVEMSRNPFRRNAILSSAEIIYAA